MVDRCGIRISENPTGGIAAFESSWLLFVLSILILNVLNVCAGKVMVCPCGVSDAAFMWTVMPFCGAADPFGKCGFDDLLKNRVTRVTNRSDCPSG